MSTRYRGIEEIYPSSPKNSKIFQNKEEARLSENDEEALKSLNFLQTSSLNFLSVKKINTNTIDFDSKYVISTDGYNSQTGYLVDYLRLIAKNSNSMLVEVAFFDKEIMDLFCDVDPR